MNKSESNTSQDRKNEYALMQRIAQGDLEAFDDFNQRYHILVFTTVYKVLNHFEDSQDVANEVMSTMWNKAGNYSPERGSLVTWICTTSRNRAIDRIRMVQRRSAMHDRFEEKVETETCNDSSSGHEDLYRSDARKVLQTAVVKLKPEQREVIELAYFEGLTQRQIAEKIESPIGTVKARIRRGVEKLRASFEDRYDEDDKWLLLSSLS